MRACESCGAEQPEDAPFRVCAKCLVEGASVASASDNHIPAGSDAPAPRGVGPFSRRRDFFAKYEIVELIAGGGQGEVWKAWDLELRRTVAMKRLSPDAATGSAAGYRFLAEAQITSQLEHPGILPVYDVGLDPDGRWFLVTKLMPRTTLSDVWRAIDARRRARRPNLDGVDGGGRGWDLDAALELLIRVCEVMSYAHGRGVIHRDLKPANVLVGPLGDLRVIDWGSACVFEQAGAPLAEPFVHLQRNPVETDRQEAIRQDGDSPLATARAGRPITMLFTAPEVLEGGRAGPETDVYSLGVMLYDLLTGRLPFAAPDGSLPAHAELRRRILHEAPVPVRNVNRSVSRDLAAICRQAMAKERTARYASMEALGADLRAALQTRPVRARNPGIMQSIEKWTRRNPSLTVLAATSLLVISIALSVAQGLKSERNAARQFAALRSAELAGRSGQWRSALRHLVDAEVLGYPDEVDLGLRRAQAWTALESPRQARAELDRLSARADLGDRQGTVLLRLAEHALFDADGYERSRKLIQQALDVGLQGAERPFAQGLLAPSTPEALELLLTALRIDPYHQAAHRHSLGLEFALGRQADCRLHCQSYRLLFPDDTLPDLVETMLLAAQGQNRVTETHLDRLRAAYDDQTMKRIVAAQQVLEAGAAFFDPNRIVAGPAADPGESGRNLTAELRRAADTVGFDLGVLSQRVQLLQVREYEQGWRAAQALGEPGLVPYRTPEPLLQSVKSAFRHHPEALMLTLAAMHLDCWQPRVGSRRPSLIALQAELYQLAAEGTSFLPGLKAWACLRAAQAQAELAAAGRTNADHWLTLCRGNLIRRSAATDLTPAECRAYVELAVSLAEYDLARQFLYQWERREPREPEIPRRQIDLDVRSGALESALRNIGRMLEQTPNDPWLLSQREAVWARLRSLSRSTDNAPNP